MLELAGGDVGAVQRHLLAAALAAEDPAVRFLLLAQRVDAAMGAKDPGGVVVANDDFGRYFTVDSDGRVADALRAMAADGAVDACAVFVTARARALAAARRDDVAAARSLADLSAAVQLAARRSRDRWLIADAATLPAAIADMQSGRLRWIGDDGGGDERLRSFERFCLDPAAMTELSLDAVANQLDRPLSAGETGQSLGTLDPEALLAIAAHARGRLLRRGMLAIARRSFVAQLLLQDGRAAAAAAALARLTCELAERPGLTRLVFREADDLDQLVIDHGTWRVADGVLRGGADGANNFATHRCAFDAIRSVVIRGGIRSPDGLNFRMAVGDLNVIWNWEVEDSNHAWMAGRRVPVGPRALTPGREHEIAVHAADGHVLVLVDDRLVFTMPGALRGAVSIYPALGSEIFVREVLIDGDLAAAGRLSGPLIELK